MVVCHKNAGLNFKIPILESVRVNDTPDVIKKYTYALENRNASVGAIIENSFRTYIAKETHKGIPEKKEELALHKRNDL